MLCTAVSLVGEQTDPIRALDVGLKNRELATETAASMDEIKGDIQFVVNSITEIITAQSLKVMADLGT